MVEIKDYIINELGQAPLSEFEEAEEETPEEGAEDGDIAVSQPDEAQNLPAVVEPQTVEAIRAGQCQVNVEGTIYSVSHDRLCLVIQRGDASIERFVSDLIAVVAEARDNSSNSWGKVVRFCDGDGLTKQLYIRNSDITTNGGAIVRALGDMGLSISTELKMRDAFLHYLNLAPPLEQEKAICSDRIGWHDNVYLLPDNTVIGNVALRYVFTGTQTANHNPTKGTREEWTANVATLCRGNTLLIMAICISFASVLLRLLKIESGGYHIYGESSTGKSTTLYVAASVHGDPEPPESWRTTSNGAEARAKRCNDALMILDELHQSTPGEAGDASYMIMNGKGKQRANVLGDARNVAEWRVNCLSSGEVAYAEFIKSGGGNSRAGQEVRMVDIAADMELGMGIFEDIHGAKDSHTFAEQLKKASSDYYGTAIRPFLERLVLNMAQLEPAFAETKEQFFKDFVPEGSSGQVQRVASKFAVAALAGEMATSMGLTGWEEDEAYNAVGCCFTRWLSTRGTTGQQEAEKAIEQIQNFLRRHGLSRFVPIHDIGGFKLKHPDRQVQNQAGFRLEKTDGTYEYMVFPESFTREMCKGLVSKTATKTLVDRGYLKVERDGKPQVRRRLPGMDQARVYHFTSAILTDAEEAPPEASEAEAEAEAEEDALKRPLTKIKVTWVTKDDL